MSDTRLDFEEKQYHGHKFIKYKLTRPDEKTETFTNATYHRYDVTSDAFKKITEHVGGFSANMTRREIENIAKEGKTVTEMMLVCVPQEGNRFIYFFTYLDENENLLRHYANDNPVDYLYFVQKLEPSMTEEGYTFDLMAADTKQKLAPLFKNFCENPDVTFHIQVDGREITYDDTLYCNFFDIFKDEMKENLKNVGAAYMKFTLDCNFLSGIHARCYVYDNNDNPIKYYQAKSGIRDINAYVEYKQKTENKNYTKDNVDDDDFKSKVPISTLRNISEHLHLTKNFG